MNRINQFLLWLKQELNRMRFFTLLGYLLLAVWIVFVDADITGTFFDVLFKLFFEMTGILAIVEVLKRVFPNFTWDDKND